jgi:SAM-dependent methyltransferase
MIAIARERLATQPIPSLSFEVSKPVSASEVENHYDIVLAFNVLHLVPSLPSTLESIYRQIKPGGLFISKTPCLRLMNPLIRGVIPLMQRLGKAPSVNVLTPGNIEAALRDAGFEIILQAWHGTKGKDARPYYVAKKS